MKLDVLFRSCSRVAAVHGNRRVVNVEKSELSLRCLKSLVRSMKLAGGGTSTELTLTIFDDHSDPATQEQMKALIQDCPFQTQFIALTEQGNGPSLRANYEYAREHATDLIYFVEDDYLHAPTAIRELIAAHGQLSFFTKEDVIIHPIDDPQLYLKPNPSAILHTDSRYWRNIGHTTATFLLSRQNLLKYWNHYMALTKYVPGGPVNEDNTINLIYRQVPCFSPMPALAVHLGDSSTISPLVNWMSWWEDNALEADEIKALTQPVVRPAPPFRDERGGIFPLVDRNFQSAVMIESKKGSVRANHYHHSDWHYCYLLKGAMDYHHRPAGSSSPPRVIQIEAGQLFFTPPLVEHAMVFTEDSLMLCLGKEGRDQATYEKGITRVQIYPPQEEGTRAEATTSGRLPTL